MILAALVEAFVQGAGLAVAVFLACKKKMNDPLRSVQYRSGGDTAFLFLSRTRNSSACSCIPRRIVIESEKVNCRGAI